jgi:hypothetical protein
MRAPLLALAAALIAVGGLSAEAATQTKAATKPAAHKPAAKRAAPKRPAPPPDPPPPPPPPADPANQVKTADQLKRESVQGAVTAPLRDLNVDRTKIPEVLLAALTDPYARPPVRWKCPQLNALLVPLNEALGPDIDLTPAGADESLMDRGKASALGLGADLASGMIPFRGVVRRVTGAEAHDRLVQSAIIAGNVRRAYLKGLGESRGCPPPATPSHERAGAAPAAEKREMPKPLYPTRLPAGQQTSAGSARQTPPR